MWYQFDTNFRGICWRYETTPYLTVYVKFETRILLYYQRYISIDMTKYGSTDEMEKLAWGGTKTSTPATVTTVQNTVTDIINLILNRNEDFSTVPTIVSSVANLVGSEILRNLGKRTELNTIQIYDMATVLLKSYMDQAPQDQSRWGNVYFT